MRLRSIALIVGLLIGVYAAYRYYTLIMNPQLGDFEVLVHTIAIISMIGGFGLLGFSIGKKLEGGTD
jgi:hypothetical protein